MRIQSTVRPSPASTDVWEVVTQADVLRAARKFLPHAEDWSQAMQWAWECFGRWQEAKKELQEAAEQAKREEFFIKRKRAKKKILPGSATLREGGCLAKGRSWEVVDVETVRSEGRRRKAGLTREEAA